MKSRAFGPRSPQAFGFGTRARAIFGAYALLAVGGLMGWCAEKLQDAPSPQAHKDRAFTEFFRRTSRLTACDGALSVPLSDGRVLWLFGDSHVDDYDPATGTMPCLFQVRNAGLLHHKNDLRNARTLVGRRSGGFKSWFKNSENSEQWFWPVCGFQNGNLVYVYLSGLRKGSSEGKWGFQSAGQDYWAKIEFPAMETISYTPLPDFHGITFGQGFVNEGGYTYAFGGKQKGLASDVYVARFKSTNPEDE
ncbi:MAG: hypothetical protein DME25_06340 [Verrucomicrobia bacterium]|nr:MAG: hypothetical protein DME25_06340 [Verrucomicrobiota bacterium]